MIDCSNLLDKSKQGGKKLFQKGKTSKQNLGKNTTTTQQARKKMADCVKCNFPLVPGDGGHRVHLICAKVWMIDLIRRVAPSEASRFSREISAAKDWEGLKGVAHAVGCTFISTNVATQMVHSDIADDVWSLFQRWYTACIGSMPARDTFVLRDERNGKHDRDRDPRPNRSRRAPVSQPTR